jgi:DivIVA domain-containing protein
MDLTPRLLTEVEFKEQWRGYSPTEVDQFLAGVASAVGELQQRHQEAVDRAMSAEQKLLERTDDDEVRRTLVLAQRTAASAVEEARAEALRIVEEARRHAADEELALAERRRVEVDELAARRDALQADIDALEAYVSQQRDRLRAELTSQLAALETPFSLAARPGVSGLEALPAPTASPVPEPFVPRPPTEDELAQAREDLVDALRQAGIEHVAPAGEEAPPEPEPLVEPASEAMAPPRPVLYDAADESGELDLRDAEATQAFDVAASLDDDDSLLWAEQETTGEVEAVVVDAPEPVEDDPFLAELRRAVTDEAPLGPRDDDDRHRAFSPEEDSVPSGRFRLRRGR